MNAPLPNPIETDPVDLGELTQSLGFMLRIAQVTAYKRFYDRFPREFRPGEFSALSVIGRNPGIRQGELASALKIKRAHMTKLVQRFERDGLVARQVHAEDRRAVTLSLTGKGKAEVADHHDVFFGTNGAADSGLTQKEYDTLLTLLGKYSGFEAASR